MEELRTRDQVADLEWRKVTSLVWPILATISIIQALASNRSIQLWQLLFSLLLVATLTFAYLLARLRILTFNHIPTIIFLLAAPFVIGDKAENAWLSFGLVIFAAVIYFSTINNTFLAITTISALTIFQSFVSTLNLPSVTDSNDLALFHTYFSFTWTFVLGTASHFIRKKYLRLATSIESRVEDEIDTAIQQLSSLKQVNQKDSRNLRLHGTILNTLIHMRNTLIKSESISELVPRFENEVNGLLRESFDKSKLDLKSELERVLGHRTLNRITVSTNINLKDSPSPQVLESLVEIIREFLLNAEKHTSATSMAISISSSAEGYRITITDNALNQLSWKQAKLESQKPLRSETLQKLVKTYGARIHLNVNRGSKIRRTIFEVPNVNLERELASSISKARILGLNDFVLNFVRASTLVIFLSIPAYFYADIPDLTLTLTVIAAITLAYSLQRKPHWAVISIAVIASLLLIPSMSANVQSCESIATLPWIWNHILTVGYFAAVTLRNPIVKWLPIAVLSIESLYYPLHYPSACQSIFLGSVPAIPLIIVMAISVLGVRKRELNYDNTDATEIVRLSRLSTSADIYRENTLIQILKEASAFAVDLKSQVKPDIEKINVEIQKIQNYLVAAEYFDSLFIRGVFEIFRDELNRGNSGKLSIFGGGFQAIETSFSIDSALAFIRSEKVGRPLNLTILNHATLELHFDGYLSSEKRSNEHLISDGFEIYRT